MIFVAAFGASYLFIALKALQQRLVVHDDYLYVMPTSMFIAACEVFVIHNISVQGWSVGLVLAIGIGSGLGCLSAMVFHKRVRLNGKRVKTDD